MIELQIYNRSGDWLATFPRWKDRSPVAGDYIDLRTPGHDYDLKRVAMVVQVARMPDSRRVTRIYVEHPDKSP